MRMVPDLITSMMPSLRSRSKAWLVGHAGLLLLSTIIVALLLLQIGFSLWRFLLVQALRFDRGRLGQCVQLFRNRKQRKSGLVRRTDQVERVLRVFPPRDHLHLLAIGAGKEDLH